jgi:hypothetical protein
MKLAPLLLVLALVAIVLAGCGGGGVEAVAGPAPSGKDCGENVAYLQAGVDAYRAAVGSYPVQVDELLESAAGQGPFVEKIPPCPGGNIYLIQDGRVREASAG